MDIVRRILSMREIARKERESGRKVGFVATMGSLHEGHLSLVRRVKELADIVVVSVFVNPKQFGAGEDLSEYPRDIKRDADLCIAEGVDYLFHPEPEEVYPDGHATIVEVEGLSRKLEGKSRPGHFRGVTTVVTKLLNIVHPHVAAFGQKDAQQAVIIQRLVKDLMIDVEILVLPIVRDEDELALSSRNRFLTVEQRRAAGAIPRALQAARHVVAEGIRDPEEVMAAAREVIEAEPLLKVDYVELVDPRDLNPVSAVEGEMLLVLAVYAGETRLLDNAEIRVS